MLADLARQRLRRYQNQSKINDKPFSEWLSSLFPLTFSKPFAKHHFLFWQHVQSIQRGIRPEAYFLILARGGGKDANVQGAITRLGAIGQRRFCLYVCHTQDLANRTIQAIGNMLENKAFEEYYPRMASRQLSKYGYSQGWSMSILRCSNGFNVMGLGLDASVRGLRLDELRADLVILSDVDSRRDSLETIEKKIETITRDILPAGSDDMAVIGIQNLMHKDSIIKRIVDGKTDFLRNRIVNGPHPAILNLQAEARADGRHIITGGTPTWAGQDIALCQQQIDDYGYTNFLIECQHEVELVEGGMYANVHYRHCNRNEVPDLISSVCFVDPAVTESGDRMGIQIDGLGVDGMVYRLYSWEENSTPSDAIRQAIIKAIEYGCDAIGFETDQGGDLWQEGYNRAWEDLIQDLDHPQITWQSIQPDFIAARAGSVGSKKHRGQMQLAEYEKGRFIHVRGTHHILEAALARFPKRKPFDLHDAAFWAQWYLIEGAPASN